MPNYKGHLAGGLFVAILLLYLIRFINPTVAIAAQLIACALFGSLFPDIDTKSKGQLLIYRMLALVLVLFIAQQRLQLAVGVSCVAILPLIVHHRGLFHRAWFILLICLAVIGYAWMMAPTSTYMVALHVLFFGVGALSHLYLDVGFKRMWRF